MHIFYQPDISSGILSEEESLHAIKVLRLQVGDEIVIVDGVGGYNKAKITIPHHKHCGYEVYSSETNYGKRNYKLHIAISPTKNIERFEWFVEKAVEIGIDEITPILCRYSERKVIKSDRLEKIIVSASKQSVKAFFTKLNPVTTFNDFVQNNNVKGKFIAHCYPENKILLKNALEGHNDIVILIGPEGDFSLEEVELALQNQFTPISLGESRLRTETAGVVACVNVAH
ncbi:MAG: 16S rRNA (uracil(1498)-N(3))-methyltransferase [Bacteroidales bacterium 36-12]|nr:MAG: 16S rRNA (uracil(1498)-N(3))-methyltransferase [Bacteroidales bacterium 36-12]